MADTSKLPQFPKVMPDADPYNEEVMRTRFAALTSYVETRLAASASLRTTRDAFVNEARAKERVLDAEIAEVEKGCFEANQERARLARALGGRTMDPEEAKAIIADNKAKEDAKTEAVAVPQEPKGRGVSAAAAVPPATPDEVVPATPTET